jgi:tetratricopeptide (TPR) repeat protein
VVATQLDEVDVPSTLTGVLQARLDSLPSGEKTILQQAAVIGRAFWDQLVEHLSTHIDGQPNGSKLSEIFSNLRGKELIFRREESTMSGAAEYIFKHDVLREVAYNTLPVKIRKRYHVLVAEWMISNSKDRVGEQYGLIGEHLELSGDKERAVETFLKAGNRALGSNAFLEAEGYYRRTLGLSPKKPVKAQLLSGLGAALVHQGKYDEAVNKWQEGLAIYESLNDIEGMVDIYTRTIRWSLPFHPPQGMQFSLESLKIIAGCRDEHATARLLSQVGRSYYFNGLEEEALRYCQQALEKAKNLEIAEVQADSLVTIGTTSRLPHEKKIEFLQKAIDIAETHNFVFILRRAVNNLASYYEALGKFGEALSYRKRTIEIGHLYGSFEWQLFSLCTTANDHLNLGNLNKAKDLIDQAEAKVKSGPSSEEASVIFEFRRGMFQRQKGDLKSAIHTATWVLEKSRQLGLKDYWSYTASRVYIPALLDLDRLLQEQDWSQAERVLNEQLELTKGRGLFFYSNELAHAFLSMVCSRQGKLEQAAGWLMDLKRLPADQLPYVVKAQLYLAEIEMAVAEENWEEAIQGYSKYVDLVESAGQRWEVARAYLSWALAYSHRNDGDDLVKAKDLYQKSLALFTEMEADGFVELVNVHLARLEANIDR